MKHAAYRLFKKPFFGRFMRPWRWPEEAQQSDWRRLQLRSQSGAHLAALLAPAHAGHDLGLLSEAGLPAVAMAPPFLVQMERISAAVRLRLSVMHSTITATPPGP